MSPGASLCPSLSGIPRDVHGQGRASSPSRAQAMPLGTWGASTAVLRGYMGLSQPQDRWEAGASPLLPQGLLALLGPSTGTSAPDHPPSSQAGQWAGFSPGTRAGDTWGRGTIGPGPERGVGEEEAVLGG